MTFKKLPYGQSNFADLIERNYAYVDKTRFVELLENENNTYQFFIRPRRFGKSLFLSTLECYYDINKRDNFESLFGGLHIGDHPTPERNKYAVIRFDFSGLDTGNYDDFKSSFLSNIQNTAGKFFNRYGHLLPGSESESALKKLSDATPSVNAMNVVYNAASVYDIPIFVIIDEYDHFANKIIAMGDTYKDVVRAGGIVRVFYESLKSGTSSVVKRIFITGASPMMISDLTSGFNIATDYSLFAHYNEMLGFTKEEVDRLILETGINKDLIKIDMEYYYNGYMFGEDGVNRVYNSQMILYLLNQIATTGKQPNLVVDANLRTDYERLRRLAGNERNREMLMQILRDGGTFGEPIRFFSIEDMYNEDHFTTLLFFMGMLTRGEIIEGRTYLKIPNYSIRTLYWEYAIAHVQHLEAEMISTAKLAETIGDMAFNGNIINYLDFFTENFLKRLSNRDLMNFDEKYIKAMMLSTLFISNLYHPVSESETVNGYTDIYLLKHPAVPSVKFEYVFEVKYVKADSTKAEREAKFTEAAGQIERYKKDPRFAGRNDLKFAAILFEGKGDYEARDSG